MKILSIAAENAPYAQVGGLSQAVSLLTQAVRKQGHDARVFMPKYKIIDTEKFPIKLEIKNLAVPTGETKKTRPPQEIICNVLSRLEGQMYPPTYFLENHEYYELRANVYGYADEHIRFALLSLGCLEWLLVQQKNNGWMPDIIHAHDWHTGYLIESIKKDPRYTKSLQKIKILYTVHNFRHQGNYDFLYMEKPDSGKTPLLPLLHPQARMQNMLLRGMLRADHVNTVSKKYAQEVQTKELGEGLHTYIKRIAHKLSGIANGIDTVQMNPAKDSNIKSQFSLAHLEKRRPNKAALQKHFKLPIAEDVPLVAFVGRLSPQKGIELILKILEHLDAIPKAQFIFLGGGDDLFCNEIKKLCSLNPTRIAAILRGDFILPRKIFAGSDILLVPSRFEPGGIVAMEALRYGCIPIVADTGGLSETVTQFNPSLGTGNGFLHEKNDMWSLYVALISALQTYTIPNVWAKLVRNALVSDFSWDNTALQYQKIYKEMLRQ